MPRAEGLDTLLAECEVQRARGSGPGGQHRNKTESRIVLVHLPTGLRVTCDETRSQHRNLELALFRLAARIEAANHVEKPRRIRNTRLRRVKEKILKEKRQRSEVKSMRRNPGREG
jgi:ribosome-associated protein